MTKKSGKKRKLYKNISRKTKNTCSSEVQELLRKARTDFRRQSSFSSGDFLNSALENAEQAIVLEKNYAPAYITRGIILKKMGRYYEALSDYTKASKLNPLDPISHYNTAKVWEALNSSSEAIDSYKAAIEVDRKFAPAYSNLGLVYRKMNKHQDALSNFETAIKVDPNYPKAYLGHGLILNDLGKLNDAIRSFDKALSIEPSADARWNKALTLLLKGDFLEGWKLYESRWERQGAETRRHETIPMWTGNEALIGKKILIHSEQGFGDTIQFCRYVKMLSGFDAEVIFEVPPVLRRFIENLNLGCSVIERGQPISSCDLQSPLLSLPLAFKTVEKTIPEEITNLNQDPRKIEEWEERLGNSERIRIGICWSGSQNHINDHNRSIPLKAFGRLTNSEQEWIALQKDLRDEDKIELKSLNNIRYFGDELKDFTDTTALASLCDFVISVDTSVAHLAATIGKEVWVLLPAIPDWRWMTKRVDSPWYKKVKLYRQNQIGDWSYTLEKIRTDLAHLTTSRKSNDAPVPAKNNAATSYQKTNIQFGPPNLAAESYRRKLTIERRETDIERWENPNQLEAAWEARSVKAADLISSGTHVLDLGCGSMFLEKYLPLGCVYHPCDVVKRDTRTFVIDLNQSPIPEDQLAQSDLVTMLGVWEYIHDPGPVMTQLGSSGKSLVCSYCPTEITGHLDRRSLGWVNDYTVDEFVTLATKHGFFLQSSKKIDQNQYLFKFGTSNPSPIASHPRVHVISYNNVGNFGDRLGYHLINEILPPNCNVTWGTLRPFSQVPNDVDLLIVGIGNSLFGDLLNDQLLNAVKSAKASIGIFGTQYRRTLPTEKLNRLLDSLTWWYARYSEDLLLYGRGRKNASHLGDWLINAFPMTSGSREEIYQIGAEIWKDLPLDRTIQKIQKYKHVVSTRLHPLLCALTSAQIVSYIEQREGPDKSQVSGKFRSLMMDVFGEAYPEYDGWIVDKEKVAAYKRKVRANTDNIRAHIRDILVVNGNLSSSSEHFTDEAA